MDHAEDGSASPQVETNDTDLGSVRSSEKPNRHLINEKDVSKLLNTRTDRTLLKDIGDSLVANESAAAPAASRATASALSAHPDLVPVIQACQKHSALREFILEIILDDFKQYNEGDPIVLFESIALAVNALVELNKTLSLSPPPDDLEPYRTVIEGACIR